MSQRSSMFFATLLAMGYFGDVDKLDLGKRYEIPKEIQTEEQKQAALQAAVDKRERRKLKYQELLKKRGLL